MSERRHSRTDFSSAERPGRPNAGAHIGRRTFIEGLAAGGLLAGLGAWGAPLRAATGATPADRLTGTEFDITVGYYPVNFTGRTRTAVVMNGSLPAPLLRWRDGDTVTLRVHNELDEYTSVHWHGILLPADMDGVPGLSFRGIPPGGHYVYRFPVRQNGTYWYHSHSDFQEQIGHYGPLVIDAREPEPFVYDREHVVMLSDWTDLDPHRLYALLKKQPDYFNYNRRTLGDFVRDARSEGLKPTLRDRLAWGRMRMDPSDLADVSGHTYTYLTNGVTPAGNWTGLFRPGERVRLRFINGSAMTYFDIRIPGLEMRVVAVDGQYVHPVTCDEFRLAVAETLDVIVEPRGADAFTMFAQSMDRTGYARGTLAVREGLSAPVPELDRVVYLGMMDMGHAHGPAAGGNGHDHGAGAQPAHGAADEHAEHEQERGRTQEHGEAHADHVDHGAHTSHDATASAPAAHPELAHDAGSGPARGNPGVDMRAEAPTPRLSDPGVGLRDNGRRVATYAGLRTLFPDPDGREPRRTVQLHLTGNMERFMWSIDGVKFSNAAPIPLRYGERVRFVLVNDTMMDHPMHLHGMWSDLENEEGEFHLRKHTLNIPGGTRRSFRVTADALGRWAFHCHLLYHMHDGMFREVRVDV